MRRIVTVVSAFVIALTCSSIGSAGETEQEIVNRFFKKTEVKHTRKISWIAANFTFNRINRDNPYNGFANYTSNHFSNTSLPWLGDAKGIGIDMGVLFGDKIAWSIGGEYWLQLGTNKTGSFSYNPPGGTATVVTNLVSEISVYGIASVIHYYVYNSPSKHDLLNNFAVRVGGSIGYYFASWNLWNEYQNLNLVTTAPTGLNTTFKGSAPAFSIDVGVDYPLRVFNLAVGVDISYLYLNFANVAWYNAQDQEIIATYDGSADGRVDLNFSGVRGKVELKRFFKW